jgi:lysine-N-methylase
MPLPVRHLPVVQNWDCQQCSNCCREYHITVTADERRRLEEQDWHKNEDIGALPLFVRSGPPWARRYRLNQRADGTCIFLSEQGRCRIHERFGAAAKPFPCRLYPFLLIPAGDHWRVGLRFACPAAAANQGRPLPEFQTELASYTDLVERQASIQAEAVPAPPLQRGQGAAWPDLLRFQQAVSALLGNRQDPMELRMRKCLALANLCRQASFDQIKGARLVEFLNLVGASLDDEVPADPTALPAPSWVGRVLFRQALAIYPRKDQGPHRSQVRSRLGLVHAAWRFARGTGLVPRVHAWLPATHFAAAEQSLGPLPEAAEEVLERYYKLKVGSLQFCGASYYGFPFWEGLEALALTLPVILWLTRLLRDLPRDEAVVRAIGMVDRNYGFNPVLGMRRQRLSLRLLTRRRELERLIAWYSR